jgi:hypothetical protein
MAHTAQMYSEETEELKAQLENVSKKFAAKAKFVRNPAPAKTREERENAPYEVMRVYEGDSQPVFKWKIHFDGSTRDETAVLGFIQDVEDQMEILDITEHEVMHGMKHLLTGEARMVPSRRERRTDMERFLQEIEKRASTTRLRRNRPRTPETVQTIIRRIGHHFHCAIQSQGALLTDGAIERTQTRNSSTQYITILPGKALGQKHQHNTAANQLLRPS